MGSHSARAPIKPTQPLVVVKTASKQACIDKRDERRCLSTIAGLLKYNDPACEANKAAANAAYNANKALCEAQKVAQQKECEAARESVRQLNARQAIACR
jgi:hypothetical protein